MTEPDLSPEPVVVGKAIRAFRERRGMSVAQLAVAADTTVESSARLVPLFGTIRGRNDCAAFVDDIRASRECDFARGQSRASISPLRSVLWGRPFTPPV
jgi:hypothetical protein